MTFPHENFHFFFGRLCMKVMLWQSPAQVGPLKLAGRNGQQFFPVWWIRKRTIGNCKLARARAEKLLCKSFAQEIDVAVSETANETANETSFKTPRMTWEAPFVTEGVMQVSQPTSPACTNIVKEERTWRSGRPLIRALSVQKVLCKQISLVFSKGEKI